MSDEPTKYVLRQKEIYAEEDSRSYLVLLSREGEALGKMEKYVFDELFVPVSDLSSENQRASDSENLKQQIEASIVFACREYHEDYSINHGDARKRLEIVSCWSDRIVALIQGDSDV